jgi:vacuolar-type H+-ATPase subunit C/Vma6
MEAVREYGFINAKVRAMRSRFLMESTYRSLAAARDARELVNQLGQTRYRQALGPDDIQSPETVEQALERMEIGELRIIEKYSKSDSRKMVRILLERYDVERLKAVLRLWHAKKSPADASLTEAVILPLPVDAVLSAPSIGRIAALLEGTPYGGAVSETSAAYDERKSLFPVELSIDRALFNRIWKAGMALNGRDRAIVKRLVGVEIDLKNLDWISRFRNYYKLSFAEIRDLLLPNGSRLESGSLQKMASEGRLSDAYAKVTRGTGVLTPDPDASSSQIDAMERFLAHVLLFEAKRVFRDNPLSIGSILGYFYLLRTETRNLKTLFACKRYGLTPQQTESLLIW